MVEEDKTWYVVHSFFGGSSGTSVFKCEGDTIVDTITYKIVYRTFEEFPITWTKLGFLREDENHQVFNHSVLGISSFIWTNYRRLPRKDQNH